MTVHDRSNLGHRLLRGALPLFLLVSLGPDSFASRQTGPPDLTALLDWLDRDRDGLLGPYEGAEAFLLLSVEADADGDGRCSPEEITEFLAAEKGREAKELQDQFSELDLDGSGLLDADEVPEPFAPFILAQDANDDGCIDLSELEAVDLDDPGELFRQEALGFLEEVDQNGDGLITADELDAGDWEDVSRFDADGDEQVSREELLLAIEEELRGATFEVSGAVAVMTGTIGASTPGRMLELLLEHPEVETIRMEDVPGSIDDEANLRAARWVRRFGLTTVVPAGGMVASGGTDFFLAGERRLVEGGARLGVHSWAGMEGEGADVEEDHPEHQKYLDYYAEMGIPAEFYWYTLEAAPADDIHWMTEEEIERFAVATERPAESLPGGEGAYGLEALDPSAGTRGIIALPESVDPLLRTIFDRYTRVTAPNGRPIHILAQAAWSEDAIVRARKVLEHLLTDVPGSTHGADKSAVADAMADRRATLILFEDEPALRRALRGPLGELELGMQDLRANECPVEGSPDYLAHRTRDAAFEEILHLVHDYGIRPALPEYDQEIQRTSDHAEEAGLWEPWPEEEPDSHRNEYIAAIYDNYLDLWTVPPTCYEGMALEGDEIPEGTSHFGRYLAGSRASLRERDPDGFGLVEAFLPPGLAYVAELPEAFEGEFRLDHDPALRYTTKSQHLRHVTLRGEADAALRGNEQVNRLTGNDGDNVLTGGGGDDLLVGGAGADTAVFRGPRTEYEIERESGGVRVRDKIEGRDGDDLLREIERLRFSDEAIPSPGSPGESGR